MTRLHDAQARLDKALSRLEVAATATHDGDEADGLKEELAASHARNEQFEARTGEMSARLDSAIGRIRSLLEG